MLVVAATGHRPPKLGGYGPIVHKRLVALAREYLREVRPDYAIQGMALGWDQAFGWACVKEGVPFTAAVPFAGQDSTWPDEARALYSDLLRDAAHVEYICSPGYAPWKMQKRNEWMVEHCGRLAALWDGMHREPDDVLVIQNRVIIATAAQYDCIRRAVREEPASRATG